MNLTDEQLDALADRLLDAWGVFPPGHHAFRAVAREAALWAAEQQGEVVWQYLANGAWLETYAENAARFEFNGVPVRAIRVIATTTKEGV